MLEVSTYVHKASGQTRYTLPDHARPRVVENYFPAKTKYEAGKVDPSKAA